MTLLQRVTALVVRVAIGLVLISPFVLYFTFRPWGVEESVLKAAANLKVIDQEVALIFEPKEAKTSGLLLVPSCPVDPVAYAPLARRIAEQGHRAVIVKVPLRCALLPEDQNMLDHRVRSLATRWENHRFVLAAHSLGALHATRIITSAVERFAGFVLMGTSQPRDRDLKSLAMPVTRIVATNDNLAGSAQYDTSLLPAEARVVKIEGGNNSQFGYFGFQLFDGIADISREMQQELVTSALLDALAQVASPPRPSSRLNARRSQSRNAG